MASPPKNTFSGLRVDGKDSLSMLDWMLDQCRRVANMRVSGARFSNTAAGINIGVDPSGNDVSLIRTTARITGNASLKSETGTVGTATGITFDTMWTYSATEIDNFNPSTQAMHDKTGGLAWSATGAGSPALPKLYNLAEWGHTASYSWGIQVDTSNYPNGNRPRPIGGAGTTGTHKYNRPVEVWQFKDNSGATLWVMDEMGSHDGACT